MSMKTRRALITALFVAGCSGGAERPAGEDASTVSVQTRDTTGTPDSAGMAGMDHGTMAGMDHGRMAGMPGHAAPSEARGGTPTMDHSRMAGMQGMDHSRMQPSPSDGSRTSASAAGHSAMAHGNMNMSGQTGAIPGIGHAGMPGMRHGAPTEADNDAGMDKLRTLVAELVKDPRVQEQIQADTALRRRWADEGVRRILLNRQ